jgi:poly-gamma-glutamate capsule biosynthesis protein CapA/YwtB (metallophosphatase superfamily)
MLGRDVAPVVRSDPSGVFGGVRRVVAGADLAMANLESPLTRRAHTARNPNALEASPESARLLARAGFDAMGVANNHAGDAGVGSVTDTIAALRSAGVQPVGGGAALASAREPKVVDIRGVRVAVLAFDATRQGVPAGRATPGIAWWDERAANKAVRRARVRADLVVVGLHGGVEYGRVADDRIRLIADLLAGWGVDIVSASGPHVVQPVYMIDPDGDGRPTVVAASLGNLLFDQTQPGTQEGALLEVLACLNGVVGYRIGSTSDRDRRVHFVGWTRADGEAVVIDGDRWSQAATAT